MLQVSSFPVQTDQVIPDTNKAFTMKVEICASAQLRLKVGRQAGRPGKDMERSKEGIEMLLDSQYHIKIDRLNTCLDKHSLL